MTMLETKKALEDALYNGNPLSFEAMLSCYVTVEYFLSNCGNKDIKTNISEV